MIWHTTEGAEATDTVAEGLTTGAGTDIMMCKVSETYDLSTQVNKMGLVSIHTPDMKLFAKHWGGAMQNHKLFKFVSCDVSMACASMLPADPLQIGMTAGDIAPQDMFNPILYKAVSNDSYNNLVNYMMGKYTMLGSNVAGTVKKNSVTADNSTTFLDVGDKNIDQFEMYYGLLSNTSGWKKAMPQAGLQMNGLYPIVYSLVANLGNGAAGLYSNGTANGTPSSNVNYLLADEGEGVYDSAVGNGTSLGAWFRGPSMRMPAIPTKIVVDDRNVGTANQATGPAVQMMNEPFSDIGDDVNNNINPVGIPYIPPCYVAVIVLPPAKLNKLYYRLKVTWTIELIGPESLCDVVNWTAMAKMGSMSYGTDYVAQSSGASAKTAMVDTTDVAIQKVMEGSG